jgi:hypothetical protein
VNGYRCAVCSYLGFSFSNVIIHLAIDSETPKREGGITSERHVKLILSLVNAF